MASHVSQCFLLKMPPEIKAMIYRLLLVADNRTITMLYGGRLLNWPGDDSTACTTTKGALQSQVLRCCRAFHQEGRHFLYSVNRFRFTELDTLRSIFLDKIGPTNTALLRCVVLITPAAQFEESYEHRPHMLGKSLVELFMAQQGLRNLDVLKMTVRENRARKLPWTAGFSNDEEASDFNNEEDEADKETKEAEESLLRQLEDVGMSLVKTGLLPSHEVHSEFMEWTDGDKMLKIRVKRAHE